MLSGRGRTGSRNTSKRHNFAFFLALKTLFVTDFRIRKTLENRRFLPQKKTIFARKKRRFFAVSWLKNRLCREWKRPNWSKKHLKKTRFHFFFGPQNPFCDPETPDFRIRKTLEKRRFLPQKKDDFLLFRALKIAASAEWKKPNWSKKHLKKTRFQFVCGPQKPLFDPKLLTFVLVKRSKNARETPKKTRFQFFFGPQNPFCHPENSCLFVPHQPTVLRLLHRGSRSDDFRWSRVPCFAP